MKKLTLSLLVLLIGIISLSSCADSKELKINGKTQTVQPYGWFDETEKNDSVVYQVNTGNVILSVIFCETVIAPVLITGTQLWEPVGVK